MDSATTDCLLCACLRAHIPFYRRHTVSAVSSLRSAKKGIFGGVFFSSSSPPLHLRPTLSELWIKGTLSVILESFLFVREDDNSHFFPASHHEHKPFLRRTIKVQLPVPVGAPPYWICHCFSQIYEVTYEPFLFGLCLFLRTAGVS